MVVGGRPLDLFTIFQSAHQPHPPVGGSCGAMHWVGQPGFLFGGWVTEQTSLRSPDQKP